ncbi:MAG: hypothetical protein R3C24_16000 [Cyanobacteriota/Melainabacteria group bacterium]
MDTKETYSGVAVFRWFAHYNRQQRSDRQNRSTATGAEEQKLIGHGNWVLRAQFCPETTAPCPAVSTRLSVSGCLRGRELSASTIGPFGMWGVALNDIGTRALTGSNNFSLRLWQIGQ